MAVASHTLQCGDLAGTFRAGNHLVIITQAEGVPVASVRTSSSKIVVNVGGDIAFPVRFAGDKAIDSRCSLYWPQHSREKLRLESKRSLDPAHK